MALSIGNGDGGVPIVMANVSLSVCVCLRGVKEVLLSIE